MTIKRQILLLILMFLVVINFFIFFQIDFDRQLPDPQPLVTESFHKDGYDESWIMEVEDDGTVWVQIVDNKTNIHFRPFPFHLHLFFEHIDKLAAVTFKCESKTKEKCDLSKPYKLYVKNVSVEFIEMRKKAVK